MRATVSISSLAKDGLSDVFSLRSFHFVGRSLSLGRLAGFWRASGVGPTEEVLFFDF